MEKYQWVMRFITKIQTLLTTTFQTLNVFQKVFIVDTGVQIRLEKQAPRDLIKSGISQRNGINQKRAEIFTSKWLYLFGKIGNQSKKRVTSVAQTLKPWTGKNQRDSVLENAGHIFVGSVCPTNKYEPVYNLTVEGTGEYFANGVLVHNTDMLRCLARAIKETSAYYESSEGTMDTAMVATTATPMFGHRKR